MLQGLWGSSVNLLRPPDHPRSCPNPKLDVSCATEQTGEDTAACTRTMVRRNPKNAADSGVLSLVPERVRAQGPSTRAEAILNSPPNWVGVKELNNHYSCKDTPLFCYVPIISLQVLEQQRRNHLKIPAMRALMISRNPNPAASKSTCQGLKWAV